MDSSDRLEQIAAALVRRNVKFVVIGGWAIEAQGFSLGYKTNDIDLTPDLGEDNLNRLSAALNDLNAEIRLDNQSLSFDHNGESLGRAQVWNLTCDIGDFDLTFQPSGFDGYRELLLSSHLVSIEVDGEPIAIQCADIAAIVHSKKSANRPKDNQVLPLLEAQLAERDLAKASDLNNEPNPSEDTGIDLDHPND